MKMRIETPEILRSCSKCSRISIRLHLYFYLYGRLVEGFKQRIFMDKELTVAPFVISTSVFCCRKPEVIMKTTPEPLLAEW